MSALASNWYARSDMPFTSVIKDKDNEVWNIFILYSCISVFGTYIIDSKHAFDISFDATSLVDSALKQVGPYDVSPHYAPTLRAIIKKHGWCSY